MSYRWSCSKEDAVNGEGDGNDPTPDLEGDLGRLLVAVDCNYEPDNDCGTERTVSM